MIISEFIFKKVVNSSFIITFSANMVIKKKWIAATVHVMYQSSTQGLGPCNCERRGFKWKERILWTNCPLPRNVRECVMKGGLVLVNFWINSK
jgi:hypothetical protein